MPYKPLLAFPTKTINTLEDLYVNVVDLCDFQFLAMDRVGEKTECIYEKLVPPGLLTPDWFTQPAPYFLPPATFSRMDNVQVTMTNFISKDKCLTVATEPI